MDPTPRPWNETCLVFTLGLTLQEFTERLHDGDRLLNNTKNNKNIHSSCSISPELNSNHDESSQDSDAQQLICQVCLASRRNVLFMPCRHVLVCNTCAIQLSEKAKCPFCSQVIETMINLKFP